MQRGNVRCTWRMHLADAPGGCTWRMHLEMTPSSSPPPICHTHPCPIHSTYPPIHPTRCCGACFGYSSCFSDERVYTYIQSRFYRAPEIIIGLPYGVPIDMWSFGCILAELYTGFPLFPGEDETEQLLCIMEILGVPPRELIEKATRRKMFFDR